MSTVKVVTIGLGYIGLPTSALIAQNGIQVHGVDINQSVVDTVNRGEIHIVEPSLDLAVAAAVEKGFLKADVKKAKKFFNYKIKTNIDQLIKIMMDSELDKYK